jgi:flagellar biosynthesis/type III secretory pathway chaperone
LNLKESADVQQTQQPKQPGVLKQRLRGDEHRQAAKELSSLCSHLPEANVPNDVFLLSQQEEMKLELGGKIKNELKKSMHSTILYSSHGARGSTDPAIKITG